MNSGESLFDTMYYSIAFDFLIFSIYACDLLPKYSAIRMNKKARIVLHSAKAKITRVCSRVVLGTASPYIAPAMICVAT
jgi:hypothetical protein